MSLHPQIPSARRLAQALLWRLSALYAARVLTGWGFAVGVWVLVWRVAWGGLPGALGGAVVLGVLGLGLLAAVGLAWRRLPTAAALLATLDDSTRGGGLFCAVADGADLNGWPVPVPSVSPPLRCQWSAAATRLAAAGLFLAGCALIPVPTVAVSALQRLQADESAGALREQMALLGEQGLVPADELQAWKEQLRQVLDDADGQEPVKTWEALDYLGDALAGKTVEALQSAQEWSSAAQQAETALATMEALAERNAMTASEQQRALSLLAAQLREAAAQAGLALPPELAAALQEALAGDRSVALSPAQRRRLQELLRQQQEARQLSPEQLARLRQLSPEEVRRLLDNLDPNAKPCTNPQAAAAALCSLAGAGCISAEDVLAACASTAPGNGGVNRGRGDATLAWSGRPEPTTPALTPQALPPADRLDLEQAQVQGVSYVAPEEKTQTTVAAGSLRAGGGASRAHTQTVLPRHRAAVEAYFGRSR